MSTILQMPFVFFIHWRINWK